MAEKIGLQAILDTAQFSAGLRTYMNGIGQVETKTSKAASVLGGLGKVADTVLKVGLMAAGAALAATGAFLGDSVKAAMEAEEVMADLNAVLASTGGAAGWTADAAEKLATSLASMTRFEDETILRGQAMLLTFTNIGKDVFPMATEAMLNMSQKMGTDVKTTATQLGKALNDPINGVTTLRRVGVMLTDQQEQQVKSLVALGKTEEAQKVILGELEKEFGGLARAAGATNAGQFDILKNKFGDLKETVAGALLPAINQVTGGLIKMLDNPKIKTALNKFGAGIERIMMGFSASPKAGGFAILTALGLDNDQARAALDTISRIATAIGSLFTFLTQHGRDVAAVMSGIITALAGAKIITAIMGIVTAVQTAGGVMAFLATAINPVTLAIAGIIAVAALLGAAWAGNWFGIRDTLTAAWEGTIKPALTQLWTWLSTNIPLAINTLSTIWTTILLPALTTVWQWMSQNLIPLFTALATLFSLTLQLAIQGLVKIWNETLRPALEDLWAFMDENLFPIFEGLWDLLENRLGPILLKISDWVREKLSGAFEWATDQIRGLISWIGNLNSAISSLLGGGGGGGGGGVEPPAGGQTGGSFVAGQPRLVGEKRPEVFVPSSNGFLYPSVSSYMNSYAGRQMSSLAGNSPAVTVNVNGDINNGMDTATLAAFINQTVSQALGGI